MFISLVHMQINAHRKWLPAYTCVTLCTVVYFNKCSQTGVFFSSKTCLWIAETVDSLLQISVLQSDADQSATAL